MPTYDYECQACNHHFEKYQAMSAPKLRTCPECGRRKLVRLVGMGAGVIFKGSGFYETDYKRAAASKGPKAETSSSSSSDSTGSGTKTKSETATASTGGAKGKSKGGSKSKAK